VVAAVVPPQPKVALVCLFECYSNWRCSVEQLSCALFTGMLGLDCALFGMHVLTSLPTVVNRIAFLLNYSEWEDGSQDGLNHCNCSGLTD